MESKSGHVRHRKQVFLVVCGAGLCVLAGYAILSFVESNVPALWTHIVMALVTVGGPAALLLGVEDQRVYRLTLWGVAIGLWSTVGMGPNALLYYPLLMPMLMLFFLGRREGTVGIGIFLAGMMVLLLLGPELVGSRDYQTGNVLKFLVGYLFVTLFGWSYEKSQDQFHATLATKNEQLQDEKKQLRQALSHVRETESRLEQTVARLQDQTRLMETIFNSISDGVIAVDENGEYLIFNPSAKRIAGMYVPDAGLGKRPETYGLFLPDGETRFPAEGLPLTRAMRGESTDGIDMFIRNQERAEGVYISVSGRPLRNDSGRAKGGVIVFRDITETKRAEAQLEKTVSELQDQTQLMQTVFDNMDEGVAVSDADGRLLLFNPSAERIVGMGAVESDPGEWSEIYGAFYLDKETRVPPDQLPLVRALRGEITDGMEFFVRNDKNTDGTYVSAKGRFIPGNDGTDRGVKAGVVVFSDITRHKRQEAQLQETISRLRRQAQLMETVFKSVSDGVVVTGKDGEFLFVNPGAEHIVGMGATSSPSDRWAEAYGTFYPDKETPFPSDELPLVRAMRGEVSDDVELFIRNQEKPDGVCISVSGRPLQDDSGLIEGGVIVLRDITRLKAAESELRQTVQRLQDQARLMETVFNSMHEGILIFDATGRELFRNPSSVRISGKGMVPSKPDEWAEIYGIFYPDRKTYIPADENPLMRAMRGESTEDFEAFLCNEERPDGVHVIGEGRSIRDAETNEVKAAVLVFRDITKLKETEAELRHTVLKLQDQTRLMETVFNSISDGVIAADENGEYLFCNSSARRIAGIGANEEFARRPEVYGFFLPDRETPFPVDKLPLRRAIRGESTDGIDMFICNQERPEGVYVSVSGRALRDDSGTTKGGVITFRDVTEIKKAESRLQRTADRLKTQTQAMETIFNSISDGVVAADENGNFTIFNPSAERIVGIGSTDTGPDEWSDQYGIFFPDRVTPFPPGELPLVRAIRGKASDEVEMFVRNPRVPEGVYISVSGRPLHDDSGVTEGGVIVFRDVTERVRAEEALSQAFAQGRLEIVDTILHNIGNAINSVATGVGTIHEQLMKNELVHRLSALAKAIEAHRDHWIPYLQTDPQGQKVMPFILALAKDFAAQNARLQQTIARVDDRVAHIVDIIRTQRSFENETMARKDINLEKAIFDAVKMLQDSLLKRGVQIRIDCKNAPKEIRIQESKYHQMLVNLIKNAIEAIDELAKSRGLEARQPIIRIRSYVQGDFLVLDVIDNGIGIEEKHFKIIFAAGYTTKKTGSGLGLHSTANFVIGSGGQIHPLSAGTGKGTTMRVKLRMASVALKSEDAGGI